MVFEKKLIILSGERGARGTLALEKNAYGSFAQLTVYNLPDTAGGEYIAGLRAAESLIRQPLGSSGRISVRFDAPLSSLSEVHCVVFHSKAEEPLLYGTNTAEKLWRGNMMDGFRGGKQIAAEREIEAPKEGLPSYSGRTPAVKDYFFDILPGERIEIPADKNEELRPGKPDGAAIPPTAPELLPPGILPPLTEAGIASPAEEEPLADAGEELLEHAREIASYNDSALAEVNYYGGTAVTYSNTGDVEIEDTMNPIDRLLWAAPPQGGVRSLRKETKSPSAEKAKDTLVVPPVSHYSAAGSAGSAQPQRNFYQTVREQIDSLFASSERFALLEDLMEETRWVKVSYDDRRYYAVGLVGNRPDYICYAVPAKYSPQPPDELGRECRFLPENPSDPEGHGFWLMFQDAATGEPV